MKKNEIKPVRAKATEGMTKEQLEDRAFAQMLLWVATAVVVEVIMLLLNRFYVHARVSELGFKVPMYKVLTAFPIVGTILFVVFLVAAVKVHRSDSLHDGTLQAAVACGFLCTGFGGLLLRNMETAIAPMVLVVVPALGVLMMVYYLYQREFFASVLVGALGLLGLWMFRSFGTGTMYYGWLDPGPGRGAGRRGPGREGQGEGRRYHPGRPGVPALPAGDGLPGLFPDRGDHGGAAAGPAGSGDRHGVLRHLGHGRLAVHPGRLLHLEADVSCRRTKNTHQTRNTGPTRRPVFHFSLLTSPIQYGILTLSV